MMKKIVVVSFIFAITMSLFSQKVENSQVKFQKATRASVVGEYNVPKDIIEKVVKNFFTEQGLISYGMQSGYMVYEQATCPTVSSQPLDVYVKIVGKKSKSIVTILASKGEDKFLSANENDVYTNFKEVLYKWNAPAEQSYLQSQKDVQYKILDKIEKKYQSMTKKIDKLIKKKEKLEKDIDKNQTAQNKIKKQFDAEKQKLDSIQ